MLQDQWREGYHVFIPVTRRQGWDEVKRFFTRDGAWYTPFYLDVGAGTTKFTRQALTALSYATKRVDSSLLFDTSRFTVRAINWCKRCALAAQA
ncbi:hypothetical protein AWB67_06732 [Caballeronia terrestris]|uniref:Uncharacterized protein n=1 Tax=Caballeronia terrestris TaxID=1226301 RepID=A0A158KU26_9BURK|nr:hypothetical protein AWB67_06732 [Caballeronia terrestris]